MNIDSIARLIESSDVSIFRTLITKFLPMIGLGSADFCDGPYDGGKDFTIQENDIKGIRIGIQISIEKNWQNKIEKDAIKTKNKYETNLLYFISSRRIPGASFETLRDKILQEQGITVVKYDNQAIASRFIQNDSIAELLQVFEITNILIPERVRKYLGAKNEAISSLLLFGQDTKAFRNRLFDSLIKSVAARHKDNQSREDLIKNVLEEYKLGEGQSVLINSHIDRLLQSEQLVMIDKTIKLSTSEYKTFNGLIESSQYEASVLQKDFSGYCESEKLDIDEGCKELLIENYLELTIGLISKSHSVSNSNTVHENLAYSTIRDTLNSKLGETIAKKVFIDLTEIVSNSEFAKHIASAKLYETLLNSDSSRLLSALGGSESLNVYIDSSVVIPIICGLLFDTTKNRFSQSGSTLYKLIKEHQFNSVIPDVYIEEVAAHLIDACRDYKNILKDGIDLSYSDNAFVSHYSSYIKTAKEKEAPLSFEDYVTIFGIRLKSIAANMSDPTFFALRNRVAREITNVVERYGFSVEKVPTSHPHEKIKQINEYLESEHLSKPDILVKHDAKVMGYLSGDIVPSGYVKLLCTWDTLHINLNPDGLEGYYIMTPVALIDYLSIAKNENNSYPLAQLLDFALMQSEKDLELSSKIWDSIAKIDNDNLSDAKLMLEAKKFKESFLEQHANIDAVVTEDIKAAWIAWKKTKSLPEAVEPPKTSADPA